MTTDRRSFLLTMPVVLAAGYTSHCAAGATAANDSLPAGARVPAFKFVYECEATLLAALDFGTTLVGHRRVIPITGGTFHGPQLRGEVVPGGADWNLQRSDGAGSVEAAYYLKTEDGVLIRVVNKGVGIAAPSPADPGASELFFMFTTPVFEAPAGKYDWMNRATFVATLGARKAAHDAVLIRVFEVV
jgi:hypothetical protein